MKLGRSSVLTAIAYTTALSATPASARQSGGMEDLSGLGMMNGTCQSLIVLGKDLTGGCEGKLSNSMYKTGRIGFSFLTRGGTVVTFSGMDTPAKGDVAASVLDHVIFKIDNTEANPAAVNSDVVEATGTCTYTNPYAGPSHVKCSASTGKGAFSVSFVSDGKPPKIERF